MSAVSIPMIPESAPFSAAQRAWLNGFFAGLIAPRDHAAATPSGAAAVSAAPAEETFPWHDPSLPMEERLKRAADRPRARQLMAAMAQLDCGSCGYDCKTYAEAIDAGTDKDLTKCSPGGSETARKLKELVQLAVSARVTPPESPVAAPATAAPVDLEPVKQPRPFGGVFSRNQPFTARLVSAAGLNGVGSEKDTRHVVISLRGSGLTYAAGDALGVYPENDPEQVECLLGLLRATGAEDVPGRDRPLQPISLREALTQHYCIGRSTPALLQLLAELSGDSADGAALQKAARGELPELADLHVGDLLARHRALRPTPQQLVGALSALRPRLYSISSSPRLHPDEVHLTVGVVRYTNGLGRECDGVASTFLGRRARPGMPVRVYVHTAAHFRPPADPDTPMIMVGPGTGIAPFRAFLQDRQAQKATGRNWLLFGDRHEKTDYLYRDELLAWKRDGLLTRLDTAFSRDGTDKCYVQHRMLQQAVEMWQWLQAGAHVYVCGDARRMAVDVDAAFRRIIAEQGGLAPEAAGRYLTEMTRAKRYQRDVY